MKIFISADIEGVAGITDWEEADYKAPEYGYFREQMSRETAAACRGALDAGATEILIKDAHDSGRNIDPRMLPEQVRLVRGWTGHPYSMMAGLSCDFHGVIYIGYHSRAGSSGHPLAHTLNSDAYQEIRINGELVSEFRINSYTAALSRVPVVFLSGDTALCREVEAFDDTIATFATTEGVGTGTISVHPDMAVMEIRQRIYQRLQRSLQTAPRLPDHFTVELEFKNPCQAYGKAFYPGCHLENDKTILFQTDDWFEVLRMLQFMK